MSDDDDFLARWSRRKRAPAPAAAQAPAPAPAPQNAEPAPASEIAEPDTAEAEAELLARLNLPVPESLTEGDDFSAFMRDGVPAFLRKRALRVLWRSNPVLANLDGLNDYDDDFTSPELTQKVLATAYKVGRGILREVTEVTPEDTPDDTAEPAVEPSPPEPVERRENTVAQTEIIEPADLALTDKDDVPAARPRRMRFET